VNKPFPIAILGLLGSGAWSATAHAAGYDYELAISYDGSRTSVDAPVSSLPRPIRARSDSDNEEIGFAGTWYLAGVDVSNGPRSRAGFVSRASSVSLSYTRGSGDSAFTVDSDDPSFPSSVGSSEQDTNNLSGNLRWVWPESGWYALAGFSMADFETDVEIDSIEANAFSLGVGKYIGAQTALELTAIRQESDFSGAVIGGDSTSTEIAASLLHIGSLGQTWQYGTDIALSTMSRGLSEGSYSARLSLYPSRSLAFGFEIDGALQDPGSVGTDYGVFASWFPRERIGVHARYGWAGFDEPENIDRDQYDFGVGVSIRF
jgi:hypothetical protein